jgi:hypothetical protein
LGKNFLQNRREIVEFTVDKKNSQNFAECFVPKRKNIFAKKKKKINK